MKLIQARINSYRKVFLFNRLVKTIAIKAGRFLSGLTGGFKYKRSLVDGLFLKSKIMSYDKDKLSNYDLWQLEKYGNIIQPIELTPDDEMFESGIEQGNRWAEWMELQADRQQAKDIEQYARQQEYHL